MEDASTSRVISHVATNANQNNNANSHQTIDSQYESFVEQGSNEWFPNTNDELRELIKFYRNQAYELSEEQKEQAKLIQSLSMTKEEKIKLEWELHRKSQQITNLQKQLSDTYLLLYKERDLNVEMQSKFQQLQLEDDEHKKRIDHLLKLLQPTHEQVTLSHGMQPFGVASYFPKNSNNNVNDKENHNNHQNNSKSDKNSVKYKNLYKTRNNNCNKNEKHGSNQATISSSNHVKFIKPGSVKLRTIYLPSDNSDYLNLKVNSLQSEIYQLKSLNKEREEFLYNDRNEAYESLMKLRDEYDDRMDQLNTQMQILSKQHMYNMKQYLQYRRDTKQLILNLKLDSFKNKTDKNEIINDCQKKIERTMHESKKYEKKLGNETQSIVHSFRKQTMEKDCKIQMMNEQLKENKDSFMYKINAMKQKLTLLTKRNVKLNRQRKYEKQGFKSDITQLRSKIKKLDQWIAMESANGVLSQNLKNQIANVQMRLEQLARSVEQ